MKKSSWLLSKREEAAALMSERTRRTTTNAAAADGDGDNDDGDEGDGGDGGGEDTAFSLLVSSAACRSSRSLHQSSSQSSLTVRRRVGVSVSVASCWASRAPSTRQATFSRNSFLI